MSDDTKKPDNIADDLRAAAGKEQDSGDKKPYVDRRNSAEIMLEAANAISEWSGSEVAQRAMSAYPRVQSALDRDELENVLVRAAGKLTGDSWVHLLRGDIYRDLRYLDAEIREQERDGQIAKFEPPKPSSPAERKQFHSETMQKLDKLGELVDRAEFLVAARAQQKQRAH